MFLANVLIIESYVTAFTFPQCHSFFVVEVYDKFANLCAAIFIGHHDKRRMIKCLCENYILTVIMFDYFIDFLLAEITT